VIGLQLLLEVARFPRLKLLLPAMSSGIGEAGETLPHVRGGPSRSDAPSGRLRIARTSERGPLPAERILERPFVGVTVFNWGTELSNRSAFSEIAPGVFRRRILARYFPSVGKRGAENSNPPVLPYPVTAWRRIPSMESCAGVSLSPRSASIARPP
jgi:hypothetical protein